MVAQNNYLVRVSCMTYNQAQYITDALNGFVMQQTNFPFVCTIIDDASTDGEQDVIRSYVRENFEVQDTSVAYEKDADYGHVTFARHKTNKNCYFAVIYLKENHYSQKKSRVPYLTEWMDTKYIALCEGDDYWTDPLKLQKQVDFLEEHADFSMCFTNTIVKFSDHDAIAINHLWDTYNIEELIGNNALNSVSRGDVIVTCGHTSTIVYRQPELPLPNWVSQCFIGDEPLFIALAQYGKAKFINEQTSVYRAGVGVSSMNYQEEADWKNRIQMYEIINEGLGYKYKEIINPIIAQFNLKIFKLKWKKTRNIEAIRYLCKSFIADRNTVMRWINNKI